MRLLGDWLESNSRKSGSRIILAADLGGPFQTRVERAAALVSSVRERVVAVKVNWHLLLPYGVLGLRGLVELCGDAGLPLIADMKINDIGATNVEAAETLFSNGFDALIANPFVGYKEGMEELLAKSREMRKGVIMLVYMSHAGARDGYGLKVGGRAALCQLREEDPQVGRGRRGGLVEVPFDHPRGEVDPEEGAGDPQPGRGVPGRGREEGPGRRVRLSHRREVDSGLEGPGREPSTP